MNLFGKAQILVFLFILNPVLCFAGNHNGGPTLAQVGELKFDLNGASSTEGSRITGNFGPGSITFKSGGGGTVETCVEDGYIKKNGTTDFEIWCHVMLDDKKSLLIKYAGSIVGGADFYERFVNGEIVKPGDGMEFWFNELKMLTSSEKYSWVNDTMFIGEGVALSNAIKDKPGIVHYKLYKLVHSKQVIFYFYAISSIFLFFDF